MPEPYGRPSNFERASRADAERVGRHDGRRRGGLEILVLHGDVPLGSGCRRGIRCEQAPPAASDSVAFRCGSKVRGLPAGARRHLGDPVRHLARPRALPCDPRAAAARRPAAAVGVAPRRARPRAARALRAPGGDHRRRRLLPRLPHGDPELGHGPRRRGATPAHRATRAVPRRPHEDARAIERPPARGDRPHVRPPDPRARHDRGCVARTVGGAPRTRLAAARAHPARRHRRARPPRHDRRDRRDGGRPARVGRLARRRRARAHAPAQRARRLPRQRPRARAVGDELASVRRAHRAARAADAVLPAHRA